MAILWASANSLLFVAAHLTAAKAQKPLVFCQDFAAIHSQNLYADAAKALLNSQYNRRTASVQQNALRSA